MNQGPISFFTGITYPFRAIAILQKHRQLQRYVIMPIAINIIVGITLYAGLLFAGLRSIDAIIANLWVIHLPHLSLPAINTALPSSNWFSHLFAWTQNLPHWDIHLPTLHLPTLQLPQLHLPTLQLPQWHLPTLQLPQWIVQWTSHWFDWINYLPHWSLPFPHWSLPHWSISLLHWKISLPHWKISLPHWSIQWPNWVVHLPDWFSQLPDWGAVFLLGLLRIILIIALFLTTGFILLKFALVWQAVGGVRTTSDRA
jgi:hypothetical protein